MALSWGGQLSHDTRVRTALNDLLEGKACIDDSRTALIDYLDSGPRLVGPAPQVVGTARDAFLAAVLHLNHIEKILRFLLENMDAE